MDPTVISDSEPIVEGTESLINFALLARVADYVEKHEEEFDMDEWSKGSDEYLPWYRRLLAPIEPAYTVGCIACHTIRLSGGDPSICNTPAEAQKLLGINDDQALRLFYWWRWPEPYKRAYEYAGLRGSTRAWMAAQRFRHFIATNGAE